MGICNKCDNVDGAVTDVVISYQYDKDINKLVVTGVDVEGPKCSECFYPIPSELEVLDDIVCVNESSYKNAMGNKTVYVVVKESEDEVSRAGVDVLGVRISREDAIELLRNDAREYFADDEEFLFIISTSGGYHEKEGATFDFGLTYLNYYDGYATHYNIFIDEQEVK